MELTKHTVTIQDVTFKFTKGGYKSITTPDNVTILFEEDNYVEVDKEALRSLLEVM